MKKIIKWLTAFVLPYCDPATAQYLISQINKMDAMDERIKELNRRIAVNNREIERLRTKTPR